VTSVAEIERRLTELRHEAAGEHPGTRTNVVELVVWCGAAAVADEAAAAISGLSTNRPSRAIVLQPADAAEVRSEESVFCALPPDGSGPGGGLVCSEVVRLHGPGDTGALPSMTRSLLLPDLPLFVLWLDEPSFDGPIARGLLPSASRLVVDSTRFEGTIEALARTIGDDPPSVSDLSWTKITGWREVVARLFDPPDHHALLPRLERIRIEHVEGSASQARLLGGWLVARAAHGAAVETIAVPREDMKAGSLVSVRLTAGDVELAVERPDEGVAVLTSPGLPQQRLALRVPPFAKLLGDELEVLARDRVLEAALEACSGW
jgi:glucose-6-phosphate dehydrogenase assembly protein OpcA